MRARFLIVVAVAILVTGGFIAFRARQRFPRQPPTTFAELPAQLEVGDHVGLDNSVLKRADTERAGRVVVIAANATCPVCAKNREFERTLVARARAGGIRVVYLVQDRRDNDAYASTLSEHALVVRDNLFRLGVARVPTMLALDSAGIVVAIWTGSIPPSRSETILQQLVAGTSPPLYRRLTRADVRSRIGMEEAYQLIGLKEPSVPPFPGARYVVMPSDEIAPRAKFELKPELPTFVDCATAVSPFECQSALLTLAQGYRFSQLFSIDLAQRNSR